MVFIVDISAMRFYLGYVLICQSLPLSSAMAYPFVCKSYAFAIIPPAVEMVTQLYAPYGGGGWMGH